MPWVTVHWEGGRISHNWVGARVVTWDSSPSREGGRPAVVGPSRWLLATVTGRSAGSPGRVFPAPRSTTHTPHHQPVPPTAVPSPRPSPSRGPGGHVFRSYDEQLRLAMELSAQEQAQEQEERRRRARQEEEELERILRLSLTEQ